MNNHNTVYPEHLLKALLDTKFGRARKIFSMACIDNNLLLQLTEDYIQRSDHQVHGDSTRRKQAVDLDSLIKQARKYSKQFGDLFVSVEHLFLAFTKDNRFGKHVYGKVGLSQKSLQQAVQAVRGRQTVIDRDPEGKYAALGKFGRNLTDMAKQRKLNPVIGINDEVESCIRILSKGNKNNPLLICESGVRKTALVQRLEQLITDNLVEALIDCKLIYLNMRDLVTGSKCCGEFEDSLSAILNEVKDSNGEIILFIDEIYAIFGLDTNMWSMHGGIHLKGILCQKEIRFIGATNLDEYSRYIYKDLVLDRCFEKVFIRQPSLQESIQGLDKQFLPGKGTNLDLLQIKTEKVGLLHLEEALHKHVVGQNPAVREVALHIAGWQLGFSNPHRPIASFVFLGPPGVGQKQLAKAVAELLFNSGEALIKIDMSRYTKEEDAYSWLIGEPQGYFAHRECLTEIIRKRPYAVILLEHIEKAHPDVLRAFRYVLEEGRVTDYHGQTVDFRNTLIFMTSRIGSQFIPSLPHTEEPEEIGNEIMKGRVVAESMFPRGFVDRVDRFILFEPLSRDQILSITKIQLEKLRKKVADNKMKIQFSDAAVEYLGNFKYNVEHGARSIRDSIEQNVVDELVVGYYKDGDSISVDVEIMDFGNDQPPKEKLIFKRF